MKINTFFSPSTGKLTCKIKLQNEPAKQTGPAKPTKTLEFSLAELVLRDLNSQGQERGSLTVEFSVNAEQLGIFVI